MSNYQWRYLRTDADDRATWAEQAKGFYYYGESPDVANVANIAVFKPDAHWRIVPPYNRMSEPIPTLFPSLEAAKMAALILYPVEE